MADFSKLGLCSELLGALQEENFIKPTPVQAATIPQFLNNRDVVVEACTGSGKTLAYLLPTLQILYRTKEERQSSNGAQVGALILCPTRELAIQIARVSKPFCAAVGIGSKLLTSGEKKWRNSGVDNKEDSERWDLVVGTPGRIDEWSETEKPRLRSLEVLIMDEADTLLSAGFHMSVHSILSRLPKQRRTGLFSATQAKEVQAMVKAGLRNPSSISVKVMKTTSDKTSASTFDSQSEPEFQKTPTRLSNFYRVCEADEKLQFVFSMVSAKPKSKFIVFFATCASVDYFGDAVLKDLLGARIFTMHGKMNAKRRALTFESFVKSDTGILACTDVVARGIDLPDVDWIVQVDAPKEPDFFVHRVGRTARAGRLGSALLLLLPNELAYVEYLSAQKVPVEKFTDDSIALSGSSSNVVSVAEHARKMVFADRDVLEKGSRAFVAYVAYYSEHCLSYLFRIAELDLLRLVKSFHLLRLPKLKEFRNEKLRESIKDFREEPASVVAAIKFKEVAREQKRERLLQLGPAFNQQQKEKNGKHVRPQQENGPSAESAQQKGKKKGRQEKIYEEWDELAREEQLYKRAKKGKLSKTAYEKALLGEDD
jgi:ATP-dependent RNA helicase DDX55/SPB4